MKEVYGRALSLSYKKDKLYERAHILPEEYLIKPCLYIYELISLGIGGGTKRIKEIVRKSLADKECEGRVALNCEVINKEKGNPMGFYYKLGFRFANQEKNKICADWFKTGAKKKNAPGQVFQNKLLDVGKGSTLMYLHKENIEQCLKYPETYALKYDVMV